MIYYEAYTEREDAEGREKFLKSGAGRRFLRAQLRHYLSRKRLRLTRLLVMTARRPTNKPREASLLRTSHVSESFYVVHLVDGTYELFRHFYGLRRFTKGVDRPYGAVVGVLQTVLQMIESGERYLGVATDHVIESFRNRLWPDYKTGAGIERALRAQFHPLEEALAAMGVVVWPMIELEADDALASAAHIASKDKKVQTSRHLDAR